MRTTLELREVVLIAAATAALSACSEQVAVPVPVVTLTAVAATNGQAGVVGFQLPQPLAVLVETDGAPTPGVTVTWHVSDGTLGRTSSVTGEDGTTTSAWSLGADTGRQTATAHIDAGEEAVVGFTAFAMPVPHFPVDSGPTSLAVVVSPAMVQLGPGQMFHLLGTLLSPDGTPLDNPITKWESLDSTVATVTTSGLVMALKTGSTTITGRYGSLEGSAQVAVVGPIASVTVIPSPAEIVAGDQASWRAEARDGFGNLLESQNTIWSSGNPHVAFVDLQGLIIGLAPGTAEIIATIEGISGRAVLTVLPRLHLNGSWSMNEHLSMDGYFPCEASGSVTLVRAETGPEISGTYVRAGLCPQYQSPPLDIGGMVAITGTTQGSSIRVETATMYRCLYQGTASGDPVDTIRGHVGCTGLMGTPQWGQEYSGTFTMTK